RPAAIPPEGTPGTRSAFYPHGKPRRLRGERLCEATDPVTVYRGCHFRGRSRPGGSGAVSHTREVPLMRMRSLIPAAIVLILGLAAVQPAAALEVGQKAPDFTVVAPGNKQVKLSEMLNKGPVVIYTFIQAFTAT